MPMVGGRQFRYDAFVSYCSADSDAAEQIATYLRQVGLAVWFDAWNVQLGDDIALSIERGLSEARSVVLCVSSSALASGWVAFERSAALFRGINDPSRKLIPVLLDACQVPDTLARVKSLNWTTRDTSALLAVAAVLQSDPHASGSPLAAEQGTATTPTRRHATEAGDATLLELIEGPLQGQVIPLREGQALTFGREEPCDVVIGERGLSRRHATLTHRGNQIWIVDHQSTNGTHLRLRQVKYRLAHETALLDGDEISLGASTFKLSIPGQQPHLQALEAADHREGWSARTPLFADTTPFRFRRAIDLDPCPAKALQALHACPCLEVLHLSQVDDQSIEALSGLALKRLHLSGGKLSRRGLAAIASLRDLGQFNLEHVALTGADLGLLRDMDKLHELVLDNITLLEPLLSAQEIWRSLKQLRIAGDLSPALWLLVTRMTGLESLELPVPIGDDGLRMLGDLRQLTELPDTDKRQLTDAGLTHIGRLGCLRKLDLRGSKVTDAGTGVLGELLCLRQLTLSDTVVGDATLVALCQHVHLRSLCLEQTQITESGLQHLSSLVELEDLRVSFAVGDEGLAHLAALRGLQELPALDPTRISPAGLVQLRGLTQLGSLDLTGAGSVDDDTIEALDLTKWTQLRTLRLGGTAITVRAVSIIKELHALRELVLANCALGDDALASLHSSDLGLTKLDLGHTAITDASANLFARRSLSELNLAGTQVGDDTLRLLGDGEAPLGSLDLSETNVSDLKLAGLAILPLHTLRLAGTKISDAALAALTRLKWLANLDVSHTRISNKGLNYLVGGEPNHRISSLNLQGTEVDDAGLRRLQKLSMLARLNVKQTRVTRSGVRAFLRERPWLTIEADER